MAGVVAVVPAVGGGLDLIGDLRDHLFAAEVGTLARARQYLMAADVPTEARNWQAELVGFGDVHLARAVVDRRAGEGFAVEHQAAVSVVGEGDFPCAEDFFFVVSQFQVVFFRLHDLQAVGQCLPRFHAVVFHLHPTLCLHEGAGGVGHAHAQAAGGGAAEGQVQLPVRLLPHRAFFGFARISLIGNLHGGGGEAV